MLFGLCTPLDKIVRVLSLLASGMSQNAVCRHEDVMVDSVRAWIVKASEQVSAFTRFMQQGMGWNRSK